jgi:hypothetical protein
MKMIEWITMKMIEQIVIGIVISVVAAAVADYVVPVIGTAGEPHAIPIRFDFYAASGCAALPGTGHVGSAARKASTPILIITV